MLNSNSEVCDLHMQDVANMFELGGKVKADLFLQLDFGKMFFSGKCFFFFKQKG